MTIPCLICGKNIDVSEACNYCWNCRFSWSVRYRGNVEYHYPNTPQNMNWRTNPQGTLFIARDTEL